jgi:hypothetical protein
VREDTKARLEAALARYEKRLADVRKKQEIKHKRNDAFVAEFELLVEETIRPIMGDVGAALRQRGHGYELATTMGYTDFDGRMRHTQIMMRVFPAGVDRSLFTSTNTPYVAFVCDWLDAQVNVQESTLFPLGTSKQSPAAGRSGKRATYAIRQLTSPVVEREIVDVLAGIFGRDRVPDHR